MTRMILVVLMVLAFAPAAGATDGVLEINQACAVHTGCFSGDGVGFPVEIDGAAGRSYRLTSDLVVPADTTGVEVGATSVSIDLGGFEIVTEACLNATTPACTPAEGTGYGIHGDVTESRGASVKNGSVAGFAHDGVFLGGQAQVTNLRVRFNAGRGVFVGLGSTVSGNSVAENGGSGIFALPTSMISNNVVDRNSGFGIECFSIGESSVRGNIILGGSTSTISGHCVDAGGNLCNGDTICP